MVKIDFKAFINNRIWFGYMICGKYDKKKEAWVPKWTKVTPSWPWVQ